MIPEPMTKIDHSPIPVFLAGVATVWGGFNEWAGEYSPAITTVFGLVAMLTGIGTLIYKVWDTRVKRQQRIRDRALRQRELDHRREEMAKRETDDLK